MNLLETLLPGQQTLLYLGNLAVAVLLSSAAALLAASMCRSLPLRHGFVLLGLALMLTAPASVWLASRGSIGLAWLLYGLLRLAAFCRGLRTPAPAELRQAAMRAAEQARLAHPPALFVSSAIRTPVTLGLFRRAIVFPEGLADELPRNQLGAVLLHEMAHAARRDPWAGLMQRLAAALYWWCPLVHRLNRLLSDAREQLCDNYVVCSQGVLDLWGVRGGEE